MSLADTPLPTDSLGLLDGLCSTRSIRRYLDEDIPEDALRTMLFAATRAPSGSNRQPFRFVVLRAGPAAIEARWLLGEAARAMWADKEQGDGYATGSGASADSPKARMARAMRGYVDQFESSPIVVLPCLVRYRDPHPSDGASIYPACQNLLLAARALGYGGVMTGFQALVEPQLREILGIPDGVTMSATITLGRPAGSHGPVRRRPLGEFVFEDRWDAAAAWAIDPPGVRHTAAGPPKPAGPSAARSADDRQA